MRSPWLAAVALGLVLLAWALLARRPEREERAAAPRTADPAHVRDSAVDLVDPIVVSEALETKRAPAEPEPPDAAPSSASTRTEADSNDGVEKPEDEPAPFVVELVEAGTDRPLPGAEVWVLNDVADWSPRAFDALHGSRRARQADDEGLLRFPWPEGSFLVLARAGDLCGGGIFPESDPSAFRARLVLHPDWA